MKWMAKGEGFGKEIGGFTMQDYEEKANTELWSACE